MIFGVLSLLGATLTLPGIIGIVLTIGIAVDSNVLIYERIREEVRTDAARSRRSTRASRGRLRPSSTPHHDLHRGAVLFSLHRPRRGFAVTLGIGIITTVFTAFTLTRLMVAWWVRGCARNSLRSLRPAPCACIPPSRCAYRPRRYQVRFHALPARQLSGLGRALDRAICLYFCRLELWHRLRRRHAARSQDKSGAPADLANMRTDLGALGWATSSCRSSQC